METDKDEADPPKTAVVAEAEKNAEAGKLAIGEQMVLEGMKRSIPGGFQPTATS